MKSYRGGLPKPDSLGRWRPVVGRLRNGKPQRFQIGNRRDTSEGDALRRLNHIRDLWGTERWRTNEAFCLPARHPHVEDGDRQVAKSVLKKSAEILDYLLVLTEGWTVGEIGGGDTTWLERPHTITPMTISHTVPISGLSVGPPSPQPTTFKLGRSSHQIMSGSSMLLVASLGSFR